jgi:hypothetical protein
MNAKLVTQDSQLNYTKSWRKREKPSNTHYCGHMEWPQNLHPNYVIVFFSVSLVKEATGKKA